jgi:hypothetical protein
MKRKTFFKALAGLIIAPSLIIKKQEGIYQQTNTAKSSPNYKQNTRLSYIAKEDIQRGMIVAKEGKLIIPANGKDKIIGVALDPAKRGESVKVCTWGKVNVLVSPQI